MIVIYIHFVILEKWVVYTIENICVFAERFKNIISDATFELQFNRSS